MFKFSGRNISVSVIIFFLFNFFYVKAEAGLEGVSLNLVLEKSNDFQVKADDWFYDNLEEMQAQISILNPVNQKNVIKSSNCAEILILDSSNKIVKQEIIDEHVNCTKISENSREWDLKPYYEYFLHRNINLTSLIPGKYTLKANVGSLVEEKIFYVVDIEKECLGLKDYLENCPFSDASNLEFYLNLENQILSNQENSIKDFDLVLKNNNDKDLKLYFVGDCMNLQITDAINNEMGSVGLSPRICYSDYINIDKGFLKSKRIKVMDVATGENKIFSSNELEGYDKIIDFDFGDLKQGDYDVITTLNTAQKINSNNEKISVYECDSGYSVDGQGNCVFSSQIFYSDKIGFDINLEKIPEILGESIVFYVTVENLTDKDLKFKINSNDCFSFSVYEKSDYFLRKIKDLNLNESTQICEKIDDKSSNLSLKAKEKHTFSLHVEPEVFANYKENTVLKTYNFILEGKINDNIKSKLKDFNLSNTVESGKSCGGEFNLLCGNINEVCNYESVNTGICGIKKEDEFYFTDIKDHFAASYIEDLRKMGIVEGYSKRLFKPNQPVTRAEFTKMLVKALDLSPTFKDVSSFLDISNIDWYFPYIETAKNREIVEGYRDTNGDLTNVFKPLDNVRRQEAVKMVVKAFKIIASTNNKPDFTDIPEDLWYYPYIFTAFNSQIKIIEGYFDNTFKPGNFLTRGEAAKIISVGISNVK